ncbi:Alcohol acetyltransferase [Penicillium brevicompactum]|uniref:Alcohol acetyltransferase n=1 Tax=Penicillium brevicompactum TaxID=5074 RepID=UPI00254090BD|nr:Alcohol acetyltransferase [Penicillium brevicompactum]KAJ5347917.1 Alcohol acetyltransferase [Penicillium brevicompactum]
MATERNRHSGLPADFEFDFIHTQPADRYQRQFSLLNRFGLQSNIIIAAAYTNVEAKNTVLSKEVVYPAFRRVIRQYPELAMIYFDGPSETKKSNHRCWSGFLRSVNLEDHVKFLEISEDEKEIDMTGLIEQYHRVWFDQSARPPWQFVVINGRQTLLVFDHYLTDGRGATLILDSLLEALNCPARDEDSSSIVHLTSMPKGFPEVDPVELLGKKPSVLLAILTYLRFLCISLFYRGTDLFFHDANYKERKFSFDDPRKEDNAVITKLDTLRLDAQTMSKCLSACREHQTSFTSLLHTLIKVSLATDFYPKAKFSHSETVIDVRPYLPTQDRGRIISTAVSMISSFDWISKFRRAGQSPDETGNSIVNAELIWDLSQKHKAHILNDLKHKMSWMQAWLTIRMIGEDEEDYVTTLLPGYKLLQNNAFAVSNLGAFPSTHSRSHGPWAISSMEFSAGAIKAGIGPDLTFNTIGVQDSATVIHVSHEEGSLPEEFVGTLLDQIQKRMMAII